MEQKRWQCSSQKWWLLGWGYHLSWQEVVLWMYSRAPWIQTGERYSWLLHAYQNWSSSALVWKQKWCTWSGCHLQELQVDHLLNQSWIRVLDDSSCWEHPRYSVREYRCSKSATSSSVTGPNILSRAQSNAEGMVSEAGSCTGKVSAASDVMVIRQRCPRCSFCLSTKFALISHTFQMTYECQCLWKELERWNSNYNQKHVMK